MTLDVAKPAGRAILDRLLEQADVLIETFAPSRADQLGLNYSDLEKRFPRLVVTSITPFGKDGPYRDLEACDLVLEAMSGWLFQSGEPNHPPTRTRGELATRWRRVRSRPRERSRRLRGGQTAARGNWSRWRRWKRCSRRAAITKPPTRTGSLWFRGWAPRYPRHTATARRATDGLHCAPRPSSSARFAHMLWSFPNISTIPRLLLLP